MEKIFDRDKLREILNDARIRGKTIVFTNGCFDIIHVGHVHYLQDAKKLGDILVVAVNSDASVRNLKGDKRPLVPQDERADVIAALGSVNYVSIFDETTPLALINTLRPDILVKGGDWNEKDVVGRDEVRSWGGRVEIIPETKGASTTNIVEKIRQLYSE
jgi:D-beta-D-heptose 7-phosphate kinase/D-beta-D-heptose 1-phosphate adenosyltransferase